MCVGRISLRASKNRIRQYKKQRRHFHGRWERERSLKASASSSSRTGWLRALNILKAKALKYLTCALCWLCGFSGLEGEKLSPFCSSYLKKYISDNFKYILYVIWNKVRKPFLQVDNFRCPRLSKYALLLPSSNSFCWWSIEVDWVPAGLLGRLL